MKRNKMTSKQEMLLLLSNESTVEINMLLEQPELVKMIRENKSYDECLNWINENF